MFGSMPPGSYRYSWVNGADPWRERGRQEVYRAVLRGAVDPERATRWLLAMDLEWRRRRPAAYPFPRQLRDRGPSVASALGAPLPCAPSPAPALSTSAS